MCRGAVLSVYEEKGEDARGRDRARLEEGLPVQNKGPAALARSTVFVSNAHLSRRALTDRTRGGNRRMPGRRRRCTSAGPWGVARADGGPAAGSTLLLTDTLKVRGRGGRDWRKGKKKRNCPRAVYIVHAVLSSRI